MTKEQFLKVLEMMIKNECKRLDVSVVVHRSADIIGDFTFYDNLSNEYKAQYRIDADKWYFSSPALSGEFSERKHVDVMGKVIDICFGNSDNVKNLAHIKRLL